MFSLRSCYRLSLSLSHTLKKQHFLSLKPLFSNINNIPRSMSARPSAFDTLMSNARAAATKKKTSMPSPKKRKTPDSKQALESFELNQDREISDNCERPSSSPSEKGVKSEKVEEIGNPSSPENPSSIESNQNGALTKKLEKPSSASPVKVKLSKLEEVEQVDNVLRDPDSKKPRLTTAKERTAELKTMMEELKKKPTDFDPKSVASWCNGERVPFLFIALVFDMISKESGRILITDIVCNMLRTVIQTTPDDLVQAVYLSTSPMLGSNPGSATDLSANRIAPAHEGVELGIGDASIIKALAEAYGGTAAHIKKQYNVLGDLGLVAKASRSSLSMIRKPEPLTVVKVFDTFRRIAQESGRDSQEKKKNHIKSLLVAATDCEPQYLIRLLQAKLRIGLAEQTLLSALGQAAVYSEEHSTPPSHVQSPLEEAAKIVKKVYSVLPVYDKIIPALLTDGVWNLTKTCSFTPGVPVGPMLAKPTKGVSEILDKFQDKEFTCEYKYDGERAQIHYMDDGSVEIYSRNAERNTGKFPDVLVVVSRLKKPSVTSFILDCELVAYDREKKKILSFQVLSTRARKNVAINDIKVEVCIFAFDILYLNGQQLIQEELQLRRQHLYDSFEEEPGYFQFATAITSTDLEEIQKFLEASVDSSCEGLIIKTLGKEATYEPSKRSHNWLKLKKDYMDSIGDSLDLVPIAAFHGRGKRTGGYGAFLLACYDSANEEFQSICKIGTGFSEAVLEERSASLKAKVISKPKSYYRYGETLNPDVWFEPNEVWEVKAADLTISPVHRAATGVVDPDKGISLRFPRLIRIREDKVPEQASSSEQVAEMYNAQKHTHGNNKDDDEDD